MRRWIEENVGASFVDGVPRIEIFRLAAENLLIEDVQRWMEFHRARNATSHTYNVRTAEAVFEAANDFLSAAKKFLSAIKARNV